MATMDEYFFIMQFLVFIVIMAYRTYNVMLSGRLYKIEIAFLSFAGATLVFGIGFMVFIINPENELMYILGMLEQWLFYLNILYLAIEIFYLLEGKTRASLKSGEAYNSLEMRKML